MMSKNTNSEPLVLAVETSGRLGSVALALGEELLAETVFTGPMRHSAELLPAVTALLKNFDKKPQHIEQVYVSIGPGSFTGLRIAVTFAKTMHLANKARIVSVDSLDVIAANLEPNSQYKTIATVLDAKRNQFFIARYEIRDTRYEKIGIDTLMTAQDFKEKFVNHEKPIWLLGEGLVYYKDRFKTTGIEFLEERYWWPKASKVHLLGWQKALKGLFANPLTLEPKYLRTPQTGISRMKSNA